MVSPRVSSPKASCLLAGICLLATAATAADLTATTDRTTAAVGDRVVLTVTISGGARKLPTPELPDIDGVDASQGGSSTNFQMVNGAVSSSHTWTWYLTCLRKGDVVIPAITAEVGGSKLSTAPITVHVVDGGAPAPPAGAAGGPATAPPTSAARAAAQGRDHFITLTADRKEAYVGEQVVLTFRYYSDPFANSLDRPQYEPPRTEGFWREDLSPQRNTTETISGHQYQVAEIRYALYATQPGDLTVGPARVTLPRDPFADFFGRRSRRGPQALSTDPFTITVHDLPQPAPPGFLGIVSRQVDLSVTTDRDSVPRGDAVSWKLTLRADGSLKSLDSVPWSPPRGVTAHDAGGGLAQDQVRGRQVSTFTQERVLVPTVEGEIDLPPAKVVWFDPSDRSYHTARAGAGRLTVTPSDLPVEAAGGQPVSGLRSDIERLATDLAFVHPAPERLRTRRAPLPETVVWWFAIVSPLALLSGWRIWLSRRRALLGDPTGLRRRRAPATARRLLAEAGRSGDRETASALVIRAVTGYVADVEGVAAAGLPPGAVGRHARDRGASELGDRLEALLRDCASVRYGAGDADPAALVSRAQELIDALASTSARSGATGATVVVLAFLIALAGAGGSRADAPPAASAGPKPGGDPVRLMAEGVDAYTRGDLDAAVDRFAAAAAATHDARAYYDLANAYARRGELGRAVVNYHRALQLRPRDRDAAANLDWVRHHTRDRELQGTPLPPPLRVAMSVLRGLSLDEWCILLAVLVWLLALLSGWNAWRGETTTAARRLRNGLLLVGSIVLVVSLWRWYDERVRDHAVVVAAEADVRSGPDDSFPVVFQVHDGLDLIVRGARGDWRRISLGGEWAGWLPASAIESVRIGTTAKER